MKGKKSCYFCRVALWKGTMRRIVPAGQRREVECCSPCAAKNAGANPVNKDR